MSNEKHLGGFKYRNRRYRSTHTRNSVIGTIITAIASTVIKDLTSDKSKIKKMIHKITPTKQIENNSEEKKIIDANYSIIENNNENEMEKK